MTIAAPGGRRLASTCRLRATLAGLSPNCNLDATSDRLCPIDCIDLHTLLEFDANGRLWGTSCSLCGMKVGLLLWSNGMIAAPRPWSRWRQ
jgi:hypothetical protein